MRIIALCLAGLLLLCAGVLIGLWWPDDDARAMPEACEYWTRYGNLLDHSPDEGLSDENIDRANKIFLVREKACARD